MQFQRVVEVYLFLFCSKLGQSLIVTLLHVEENII